MSKGKSSVGCLHPTIDDAMLHSASGSATSKNAGDKLDQLLYHVDKSTFSPFTNSPKLFTDRLIAYLNAQFSVKIDIKSKSAQQVIFELTGRSESTREAETALNSLFSSIKTKFYSKQSHGKFNLFRGDLSTSCTILSASIFACPNLFHVVQWEFSRAPILASSGFVKKDGGSLSVKYYTHQSPFGVKDEDLDAIVLRRLTSASEEIPYLTPSLLTQLTDLEKCIQKRPDYGHEICCWFEHQQESGNRSKTDVIYLYGKEPIVKQFHADVKSVMNKYMPKLHDVALSSFVVRIWYSMWSVRTFCCFFVLIQISYLREMCVDTLIQFAKNYEADGVEFRFGRESGGSCQFLAPEYLRERVKVFLLERSHVQVIQKEIRCSQALARRQQSALTALARKSNSLLSIVKPPAGIASPLLPNSTQSTVTSERIYVSNGDLTREKVRQNSGEMTGNDQRLT